VAKRGLGKGIDALLQGLGEDHAEGASAGTRFLPLEKLKPNPHQPRKNFSREALQELADSIRSRGVLQPILVEETESGDYLVIAGERRFRAAGIAGLSEVPVIVRSFSEEEKLEIALIENIQREDLNPVEEALAYRALMDASHASQDEIAGRLGKNRSTIANSVRLLKLPEEVQAALVRGELTAGHARALLSLESESNLLPLFRRVVKDGLSVRECETEARRLNEGPAAEKPGQKRRPTKGGKSVELREIEDRLLTRLGTRVVLNGSDRKGKIEISYFSTEDLERLIELLGG
jgi:ParB family transcriptional regulator, chromosome partitioning protein